MRKMLSEILKEASSKKTKKEKAQHLVDNDSIALRRIIHACFHPDVKFLLPDVPPPYQPASPHMGEEMLYGESKKLYHFIDGGNPNLKQYRREHLFIQFLETIHPDDAVMMINVYRKKSPFPTLTREIAHMAFPDLIPAPVKKEKKE